MKKLV